MAIPSKLHLYRLDKHSFSLLTQWKFPAIIISTLLPFWLLTSYQCWYICKVQLYVFNATVLSLWCLLIYKSWVSWSDLHWRFGIMQLLMRYYLRQANLQSLSAVFSHVKSQRCQWTGTWGVRLYKNDSVIWWHHATSPGHIHSSQDVVTFGDSSVALLERAYRTAHMLPYVQSWRQSVSDRASEKQPQCSPTHPLTCDHDRSELGVPQNGDHAWRFRLHHVLHHQQTQELHWALYGFPAEHNCSCTSPCSAQYKL